MLKVLDVEMFACHVRMDVTMHDHETRSRTLAEASFGGGLGGVAPQGKRKKERKQEKREEKKRKKKKRNYE